MIPSITPETVRLLATVAGVQVEEADLPEVATRLAELYATAAQLNDLDLVEAAPELAFDARWQTTV